MTSLWIGLAIIVITIFVLSDKARVLLRGFIGIFIKDLSQSPEGIKAIYEEAINKAQTDYNRVHDALSDVSGKQQITRKEKEDVEQRLKVCEQKCERAAQENRVSDLKLFAEERAALLTNIRVKDETLAKLDPLVTSAQEALNHCEKELKRLKAQKDTDVSTLETNQRLKEAMDRMDELKKSTTIDRLLDDVNESVKASEERVAGARVVHESKLSTKLQHADDQDQMAQHQEYINSLLAKYQHTQSQ